MPDQWKQNQKYRGMFETQKSRNKTSSGDTGLNIRTLASPKVRQDQVGQKTLLYMVILKYVMLKATIAISIPQTFRS